MRLSCCLRCPMLPREPIVTASDMLLLPIVHTRAFARVDGRFEGAGWQVREQRHTAPRLAHFRCVVCHAHQRSSIAGLPVVWTMQRSRSYREMRP